MNISNVPNSTKNNGLQSKTNKNVFQNNGNNFGNGNANNDNGLNKATVFANQANRGSNNQNGFTVGNARTSGTGNQGQNVREPSNHRMDIDS